ncbi:translation initiation factor eIF-2B epsilon subunit, GEF [Malassezia cuniculi]|uniref:Translation initiation factor eIF2B subunit epsilon n=1 Tax=Malassezia cuniculi TaxID=948313 RepID=A0AAF0EWB4_9BASI|nr:translation initiation factor eIF-2B epsilon subunit, GEF [Malassezia cuniculi]
MSLGQDDMVQDEGLQAVVLCDVFNQRFSPLTLDIPRCLMPLCNAPLIEWTLESLALAGVQEVFFLAAWHTSAIREYLETHHPRLLRPVGRSQANTSALTRASLIAVPEARSIGDAMRELDAHQVIKGDFLLVHGDAVGCMDLASIVQAHRQRRRADRNAIMTICTMPCAEHSRSRPLGDQSVFTTVPATSQLVHYTSVPGIPPKRLVKLPLELFEDASQSISGMGAELDVRNDLVDCGVDVCSLDVPPLFTENFDYQSLRRDFVHGILTSDLLESKIYIHVAPPAGATSTSSGGPWSTNVCGMLGSPAFGGGYMMRASDPVSYDAASRDILSGWTHPFSPRNGLPGGAIYKSLAGLRYIGEEVAMAKSAHLGNFSLLGAGATVEENAQIRHSILGRDVIIGAESAVSNSYIWDGVTIGRNCSINGCIISRGVRILDGVSLSAGTLVGEGCVIGPCVALGRNARISRHAPRDEDDWDDDDDGSVHAGEDNSAELGTSAQGYLWPPLEPRNGDDSDDEDEDPHECAANAQLYQILNDTEVQLTDDSLSSIDADSDAFVDSDTESDISSDDSIPSFMSARGSMSLTLPDGAESQTLGEKMESEQRLSEFRAEAEASLARAMEESHAPDNAAIELKTLRMASNVPTSEVKKVAIPFILGRCNVEQAKETADFLDHWGPLIREVAQDDQVEALAVMQSYCALNPSQMRLFVPLLKKVYNDELVADEAMLAWWKHPSSRRVVLDVPSQTQWSGSVSPEQIVLELRKRAEPVVRHIIESLMSDDDDDDSDDEEEEEDE